MEWLIDNWFILVGVLAIVVFVVVYCWKFTGMPTDEQIRCVKEWLKYAVAMAEKELQSGTGQLKLRLVYQRFIETFPTIAKVVSFEVFSEWVDDALVWLNDQLSQNKNVKNLIESGNEGES